MQVFVSVCTCEHQLVFGALFKVSAMQHVKSMHSPYYWKYIIYTVQANFPSIHLFEKQVKEIWLRIKKKNQRKKSLMEDFVLKCSSDFSFNTESSCVSGG